VDHHEVVAIEIQKSSKGNYIYTLPIVNVEENEPIVMMDVEDLGHTDDYVTGIFGGVVEFRSKSVDAYEESVSLNMK